MRRTSTFASVVNAIADEQTYTDENGTARNGMKNNDCEKKINNSGFTSCRDSTCWADATEATAAGCRVAAAAIILLLLLLLLLLPYHYNIIIITITITIIYYYRCCTMTPPPRAYIRCTVVGASVGRTAGPPAKRLRIPPPPRRAARLTATMTATAVAAAGRRVSAAVTARLGSPPSVRALVITRNSFVNMIIL